MKKMAVGMVVMLGIVGLLAGSVYAEGGCGSAKMSEKTGATMGMGQQMSDEMAGTMGTAGDEMSATGDAMKSDMMTDDNISFILSNADVLGLDNTQKAKIEERQADLEETLAAADSDEAREQAMFSAYMDVEGMLTENQQAKLDELKADTMPE